MCRKLICLACFVFVLGLFLTSAAHAELVGWWRLDEGSGMTAYDSSGNGFDGTLTGDTKWVAGKYGAAVEVDGDGDYVEIPPIGINSVTVTMSTWIKRNGPQSDYTGIFFTRNMPTNTLACGLMIPPGGTNIGYTWNDNSTATYSWASGLVVPDNEWCFVALVVEPTQATVYVNEDYAVNSIDHVAQEFSEPLWLGQCTYSANRFFDGQIDDARVYDRALTQGEVQTVMYGGEGYPYALSLNPADGALHADTWASMSWRAGDFAVSHDVYFGESFDDVNDGLGDTFRGNQGLDSLYFVAGFSGYAYPDGLVPGTTYYWRIDEVNDADPNSPWKGKVWSFWIPPKKAYEPVPGDGGKFIDSEGLILSWTAGFGAKLHTVYFGDDFDTVANATGGLTQGVINFNPGPLEVEKTYYWRVDEFVDAVNTYTGDVWSFTTTIEGLGEVVMERWENIPGSDIPALTSSWKYPNNPDVTERLTSFSWDQDLSNYGGRIHGWLYAPGTGDYTFWLCADNNGELWLSTDDDSTKVRLIAQESNWSNPNTWGTGEQQSDPIPLVAGQKYYIMALWKEEDGGDQCQVAWQGPGVPTCVIIPGGNLSPYEPLNAFGAKPSNNATDVTQTPIIQWKAGLQAASHELYFGTDEDAVKNATKASPEYKGSKTLGDESYDPGKLPWETTYYWRVDEVNSTNPGSPWVGNVWNFTTADFLIIDDFEDYDAGDNQIWYSWHDGLGYGAQGTDPYFGGNGSGAAVGDETTASYTEETIVHGGSQSMPYNYDNNKQGFAMYSEAELTLSAVRDWTEEGVANLSLWFRGNPASTGSLVEGPVGTYTMTGSGADIWNQSDEFHYAYKTLSGSGSILAKVESLTDTHASAKAAVMIRDTLAPDSKYWMAAVTPGSGVIAEYRAETGENAQQTGSQTGITAPYWVKIVRDLAGNFTAYSSANGSNWQMVGVAEPIQMGTNVSIGLAVTSHDAALTCQAVFSNVTTTGSVGPQWANQDIGIASNDAEPLYVAVSNSAGAPAVVVYDDPAAAQIDTWTRWVIPLQALADQGITLTNVDKIAIGLGSKGNMTIPGGAGKIFIDDIRLYRTEPEPEPEPQP